MKAKSKMYFLKFSIVFSLIFVLFFSFGGISSEIKNSIMTSATKDQSDSSIDSGATSMTSSSIHPDFVFLDNDGKNVFKSGKEFSYKKTCGTCHDVNYIQKNSFHPHQVSCIECHVNKGDFKLEKSFFSREGAWKKEDFSIHSPSNANCSRCHQVIGQGDDPLKLPKFSDSRLSLTEKTGVIFSPQLISQSALNIKGKEQLNFSWDIHMARGLSCVDCHYSGNNPRRLYSNEKDLKHLTFDPRQKESISDYLKQPNHRLKVATCESCHDPMKIHSELAYKKRHFEILDCQACHVPQAYGPSLEKLDRYESNIIKMDKFYRMENSDQALGENQEENSIEIRAKKNLNTAYLFPYKPELFSYQNREGKTKIGPFNRVQFQDKKENYQKELLFPLKHGVHNSEQVLRDCNECHGSALRLNAKELNIRYAANDGRAKGLPSAYYIDTHKSEANYYVMGSHKNIWIETVGWLSVALTFFMAFTHGGLRYLNFRKRVKNKIKSRDSICLDESKDFVVAHQEEPKQIKLVYMYSVYERIWHWLTACGIILLMLTGFQIHYAGKHNVLSFQTAVSFHNILAGILIINAFLSLFYHLASANIRQFIPPMKSFISEALAQIKYYT